VTKSHFTTAKHPYRPSRRAPGSEDDRRTFRAYSWFRRLVALSPGDYVLPSPKSPDDFDPMPPREQLKGEPVGPRKYLGRVNETFGETLALTLWEVPNGRELLASVSVSNPEVTTDEGLHTGTPVTLWTWREFDEEGSPHDRVHIARSAGTRPPPPRDE
jgi:hypothetical protein